MPSPRFGPHLLGGCAAPGAPLALLTVVKPPAARGGTAHARQPLTHAQGGDTAGAGVICGALLGTLHGPSWVPRSWFSLLDNGLHGRDFAIRTGKLLAEAFPSPFDADWARSESAEPMARVGALHSNDPDQE